MAQAKSITNAKTKNFTFRITQKQANNIASIKSKCSQQGIKINMTSALSAALDRELKALQTHIQKNVDAEWEMGQESINFE